MGRRERHGGIRGLRARDRGHRSRVDLASAVSRPAETPLWFDPSLRTAAELMAERVAGAGAGMSPELVPPVRAARTSPVSAELSASTSTTSRRSFR
ncbi:MAG: hypothetical protein AVDCRST_MAG76-541 [uncultured Acidimicrobiales bacterium]|uniref:Uncharacterized protein n=1 Tax=uncultured Acidimicrobiales bacterium TaxID=310071 RepID=A0A6J4HC65_9ACTN|nr:MAG: hypothetical protein AVDCRST_MAG76-541 [uncultured Acidimicrobiales bacterium]